MVEKRHTDGIRTHRANHLNSLLLAFLNRKAVIDADFQDPPRQPILPRELWLGHLLARFADPEHVRFKKLVFFVDAHLD